MTHFADRRGSAVVLCGRLALGMVMPALLIAVAPFARADAITITLQCISGGCNGLVPAMSWEVTESGDKVVFTIRNNGAGHSSITGVYWDDGRLLLSNPRVAGAAGVNFAVGGSPANLPGGKSVDFAADFSVTNVSRVSNGINPNEWLEVTFTTTSISDVLEALNSGDLRVGLFAQSPSGSFVSGGPDGGGLRQAEVSDQVPEPATALLLGTGIGVVGYLFYRRRKKASADSTLSH